MSLYEYRNEYTKATFEDSQLRTDPQQQFHLWLQEAISENAPEPTAMTLSTVEANGQPTARIVLLKSYEHDGLRFFTNYHSRKAVALEQQPQACLSFFWPTMQRQVRFEGVVSRIPVADSQQYFDSRPLASRLSAIASPQSRPLSREHLETKLAEVQHQYGEHPPYPEFWGGYVLQPHYIEFWQGRTCRLHDRFAFERLDTSGWHISRLAP